VGLHDTVAITPKPARNTAFEPMQAPDIRCRHGDVRPGEERDTKLMSSTWTQSRQRGLER
jgi:hypothetical protein